MDEILGAAASGVSLNVIDKITKENCKVHFSAANTSPEFTDYDDGDLYFRTAPSDVLQGRILSDLIVEDGHTTVALLARQDSYGEGLLQFTKEPLEEQGAEVVVERVYDPEAQTFSAEVDEVISADPDARVMIGFAESSIILNDLFEQGFTPDEKGIYLVDGNIGNALGEEFSDPGVLVGVKGTLPTAELTGISGAGSRSIPRWRTSATPPRPTDAVVITALAAEVAGSDYRPDRRQHQRRHPRRARRARPTRNASSSSPTARTSTTPVRPDRRSSASQVSPPRPPSRSCRRR